MARGGREERCVPSTRTQATSAGRREHVGARADLKVVAAAISKQLRLPDKVVRYRFGDNAELMGAWESARNAPLRSARRVAGLFHTTNEPQSGAPLRRTRPR